MSKTTEKYLDKLQSDIKSIFEDVHKRIASARKETYKLLGTWKKMKLDKTGKFDEDEELMNKCYRHCQDRTGPEEDDLTKLFNFANVAYECARDFQEATQKLTGESPREVLRVTTRAGVLLYYVEHILLSYEGLKDAHNSKSLPTDFGAKILSRAMTVVATARDQIIAAEGYVKNLKEKVGSYERLRLIGLGLLPTLIAYLLFHLFTYGIPRLPSEYRVYWEVVFWSLFGAISISFITISEDVNSDDFDPRHLNKYEYKIAVAPFIAAVLVFFVSQLGIVSGDVTIKLDLANPNFPVVILLSFVFGFFGKRSLDLLDNIWQRVFPFTRGKKKQETVISNQNSPSESETASTL